MKKTDIKQAFRRALNRELERSGMTAEAAARKANLNPGHLSEVRRGLASITIDKVNDLAYALGVEPWELLLDEETVRENIYLRMITPRDPVGMARKVGDALPPAPKMREPQPKTPANRLRRKPPKKGHDHHSGD